MDSTLRVDVVSAERAIFSGVARMIFAPGEMGELGILPRHAPLLTRLRPGTVRVVTPDGEEEPYYISGGLLEIQPHHVTILADTALRARDIDEAAALEAKRRAEEVLHEKAAERDHAIVQQELVRAAAQLHTLAQLRKLRR